MTSVSYAILLMMKDSVSIEMICNICERHERQDLKTLRNGTNGQIQEFSKKILEETCWVCQLFGSLWFASKLQIRDLYVDTDLWFDQYQQRDGVAIDRDTETASEGKLYDYEVVPAGVLFEFQAIVDNAADWQLGMLYLGLTAFKKGELTIGGGSSRGLGAIALSLDSANYIDSASIIKHLTEGDVGSDADWETWLNAFQTKIRKQTEGQLMHKRIVNQAIIEITISPVGPLLIKASDQGADPTKPDMEFVETYHKDGRTVYLPGSSLKGAIRAHCERIVRTLESNVTTCDPTKPKTRCKDLEEENSAALYKKTCTVCQIFGSTKVSAHARIADAYPDKGAEASVRGA